jgi:hypothetical protein
MEARKKTGLLAWMPGLEGRNDPAARPGVSLDEVGRAEAWHERAEPGKCQGLPYFRAVAERRGHGGHV